MVNIPDPPAELPETMRQSWELMATGEHSDAQISEITGVTTRTVQNHRQRFRERYGVDMLQVRAESVAQRAAIQQAKWVNYREEMAAEVGALARATMEAVLALLPKVGEPVSSGDGNIVPVSGRDVQAMATALGILVDKADKLAGVAEAVVPVEITLTDDRRRELFDQERDYASLRRRAAIEASSSSA